MARPIRKGLDYFPMDVNIFEDDKLQFIAMRFEQKGELLTIKLLCKIYNNGYYINWNDDVAALFAKSAGGSVTLGFVNEVVYELLKRDFFDKALYTQFAILTSHGIQKRYLRICSDAKRVGYEIPAEHVCTGITPELSTQRKEKESTGKEKKEEESKEKERKVKKRRERKEIRPLVFLSDLELKKLAEIFNDEDCNWMYDTLHAYKAAKGVEYKSDYGAICKWVKRALQENKAAIKKENPPDSEDKIESALSAGEAVINHFKNLKNAAHTPNANH
jgi:hypothetical protein